MIKSNDMKKFLTNTTFEALRINESGSFEGIKTPEGKKKTFKTRKAAESYCNTHKCMYVEWKCIFYR
jgi:hypothetical protein